MLSAADQDVIRRDSELPGLGTLLDEQALRTHLQQAHDQEIGPVTLRYLRYKAGTNCLASFDVQTGARSVLMHGKAWREKDRTKFTDACARPSHNAQSPLHRTVSEKAALITEVFPDDARLKTLRLLADREARQHFLEKHATLRAIPGEADLVPINYKPERRFVGALSLGSEPFAAIKVYSETAFQQARRAAQAVRPGKCFGVSECLRASEHRRALVFNWCAGSLLSSRLANPSEAREALTAAARGLAELHSCRALDLPALSLESFADKLFAHARSIGTLQPHLVRTAMELAQGLACALMVVPELCVPLHGDFYAKQVLFNRGEVTFLDFDEAVMGHPLLDVGTFLAHLDLEMIRGRVTEAAASELSHTFCEHYFAAAKQGQPAPAAHVFHAAELLALAPHFFRRREPDWPAKSERAIARAAELLRIASAARSVRPARSFAVARVEITGEVSALSDQAIPHAALALNPAFIDRSIRDATPALAQALDGRSISEVRVLRHKQGRRCLIEYGFRESAAASGATLHVLGKVTAKPAQRRASEVASRLRAAGWNDSSEFAVPEPLGALPEAHMELQRKVPGRPVAESLLLPGGVEVARHCARLIHALHSSSVIVARTHNVADELEILADRFQRLGASAPALKPRLSRLLEACLEASGRNHSASLTLVHRDFYPDQVLQDGARFWLLDLDLCAMSDPCLDHGNFLAHLVELGLRKLGSHDALAEHRRAYLDEALKLRGFDAAEPIELFTTLSLARHIFISTQFPDRTRFTGTFLDLCEARLQLIPQH